MDYTNCNDPSIRELINSATRVSTQWVDEINTRLRRCADDYNAKEIQLTFDKTTGRVKWLDSLDLYLMFLLNKMREGFGNSGTIPCRDLAFTRLVMSIA